MAIGKEVFPVNLEDEMRQSYLDYAMSVIVGRALPDVRDGLKPVHRRVLYAMRELGNDWNKAYKKSARVVGDVIGKYHPHGDTAVYDTIVRMAQPFSHALPAGRRPGQLRLGRRRCAGGHALHRSAHVAHRAASCSPTSTRKPSISSPNYDEIGDASRRCCRRAFPNLLVNGSSGIAVGMATNIPPHNLTEIVNALPRAARRPEDHARRPDAASCRARISRPPASSTARRRSPRAYTTGRGRSVDARAHAHRGHRRSSGRAGDHHHRAAVPGEQGAADRAHRRAGARQEASTASRELRDESDKDGMRVVIELKRGEVADVVLNNLYKQTPMETRVRHQHGRRCIDGQPKLLSLKEMLEAFLRHRREVVTRRTIYDLRKARERAHILEGLAVALANIDEVIALIKASPSPAEARRRR